MSIVEVRDHRWRTTLSVTVRGPGAARRADEVRHLLTDQADRLERLASRFRTDSEIARANAEAGSWVPVSRQLEDLIEVAVCAAEATEGLVSPCLGRQVDAAGYRSWAAGEVPVLRLGPPVPCDPDAWQHVEIAGGRLRFPADVELDLGATAKAWLADEVAERVAELTGLDVVANMGGDLRAIADSEPWTVGVDHEAPERGPGAVMIGEAGLATSGQGGRRWRTAGGTAHHLIDPRTGRSARTRWWAASVLAATATAANTAATAAMLLDDLAVGWLDAHQLDGVLTRWDGTGALPLVRTVGRWPVGRDAA